MSKIRECFLCGIVLATSERQRVRVEHKGDKSRVAEVCRLCWWKVRAASSYRVAKNGKTYQVRVRDLQLPLWKRTARRVVGGG